MKLVPLYVMIWIMVMLIDTVDNFLRVLIAQALEPVSFDAIIGSLPLKHQLF